MACFLTCKGDTIVPATFEQHLGQPSVPMPCHHSCSSPCSRLSNTHCSSPSARTSCGSQALQPTAHQVHARSWGKHVRKSSLTPNKWDIWRKMFSPAERKPSKAFRETFCVCHGNLGRLACPQLFSSHCQHQSHQPPSHMHKGWHYILLG